MLRKCTKPLKAIGPPKKTITCNHMRVHWTWCKPSKYCCVPSRDRQNWWKRFNLQCPRFFQLPYHLLSNSNFDFRCFLFFFFPSLFLLKLNAIEFWTKSSLILIQCWIPFIPVYFLFVWFVLSSSFVSFSCSFLSFSFYFFNCPFVPRSSFVSFLDHQSVLI